MFCSHATRLHTKLTELLLVACFVLPFYMRKWSVWWRFLKWNVRGFAFSTILLVLCFCFCVFCTHCCLCVRTLVYPFFSHACCYWFTWNKFDVFVSVYLLLCVKQYYIVSLFKIIQLFNYSGKTFESVISLSRTSLGIVTGFRTKY